MLDARQLEQPLAENERILRDHFVSEYLKDFNAYQACIRVGFQHTFALEWSIKLFNDGYVQRKIQHLTRSTTISDEEARVLIQNRLLEIAQRGSDSASVSAMREYNAMKGWSKPDGSADGATEIIDALKEFAQRAPA